MNGTHYDTKDNNLSDNMHDDFLNYPNFKKFINSNNNSDHENFEESRKYIHREITKTLNANSVKVCRNNDERILPGNTSNKLFLKGMENKSTRKDFSYSGKNDSGFKGNANLNKFVHCSSSSSSGRRSNEECGLSSQTGHSSILHPRSTRSMKNFSHASNQSGVNSVTYSNNANHLGSLSVNHVGDPKQPGSTSSHRAGSVKGKLGTGPSPSSQFFHGTSSNDLSDNNNHHPCSINYMKKIEMNNEDMDRINEALLLKEKKNILKHEFLFSEPRCNTALEEGDNKPALILDNFMFENEDKLGYVRSSSMNNHTYDLAKSNGNTEDVKLGAFTSNEFGLVPIKGEDIKKKKGKKKEKLKLKEGEKTTEGEKLGEGDNARVSEKGKRGEQENGQHGEHENIAHFIKQQILENAKIERGAFGDPFKNNGFFPNSHGNSVGVPLDNNSASMKMGSVVGAMHAHRYEAKKQIPGFQKRMSEKRDSNNFRGMESDPNKFKKYNHLKDNFHLNNNQMHFYPNVNHLKNKSELFLTPDVNDKVYANNIMYDDYFTIENMETCNEKKEFFKNEGLHNKMKKEKSLAFRMHTKFDTKELITNRKKYFHFAENRDLNASTNHMKSDYYNESNMNEFSLDNISSQYIFAPKDYAPGNNLNREVLGLDGHMEKVEYASSLLEESVGDQYSTQGAKLPNGIIVEPPPMLMYDTCNGHAYRQKNDCAATHADFGSTSVHGNVRSTTVHTDNNGQEEENENTNTLVNTFTLKREQNYYQSRSEMTLANEMSQTNSVNMADVSSVVFNSNSCSLSNGNGRSMNNNSNMSSSIFPGKAVKGSNTSMLGTYDMVSPEDSIRNGVYGGHINGSLHQQGENNGVVNGVVNGVDNGVDNGIHNGINNGIHNGIEKENEEPVIKLFFGNLAPITTEKDMHNLFSNFGKCDSLIILKDRRSKSRGSGFVTFYNMQEAVNAIKSLNNKIILSGAHKPLEVRFPENKEEKKLRTKLLNAAKWKGKKIAPSGCLPISTEDILNQNSLHVNNGPGGGGGSPGGNHHLPYINPMETRSYFLTENQGAMYDNRESVIYGCTGGGMLDCANVNMVERASANHYNTCSGDFSELRKAASEATNDTALTDYVNRVEEGSNMCSSSRYNSYKKGQENLPDDMNNRSLSKQRKKYSKFLPNFLLDNNAPGNLASNSFQSLDEAFSNIRRSSLDVDVEEVNVRSNGFAAGLGVNGGLGHRVVHETVHEKIPCLRSESSTAGEDTAYHHHHHHHSISSGRSFRTGDVQKASGARGSDFSANGFVTDGYFARGFPASFNSSGQVMDEGDEAHSYFSSFCHGFPVQSKIMEDPNNTFFSYLNKDKILSNHNKGEEEVYQHKMDFCKKGGDFAGINELEEINHFRQLTELEEVSEAYERGRSENDMRNVLLRGSEEMAEVGKEENLLSDIYEGNKVMASAPMNEEGYSNMNVHYLGFDLSRLIQINEDILLPQGEDVTKTNNQNDNSNVGSTSHQVMEDSHVNGKEIMTSDFYQHGTRSSSSRGSSSSSNDGNDMCKLNVGHAHGTMDLLNVDLIGNKDFDLNDNLSDEMLGNLISLYAQNKSSMITSHMFSYLNNVLCDVNSALDIFNKFSVKTPMKNIAEEESLPE
ncbi:hypothetical protein AK88_00129 [Plasmodium fragile]|uniref:RRM domain-containing protein n=1 Tax=Plasmodium fragile TaxID=5857 RepID=A0A0D9QUE8_PLAFR|nr:uncharacterized protein AK88_00129 [Plasmodium fragile]KJP90281.1 hypothetical protein AK88_00129 [Plasmodium fragile]